MAGCRAWPARTIRLETTLAAYCTVGERWAVIDLERLISEGRGEPHFDEVFSKRKLLSDSDPHQPQHQVKVFFAKVSFVRALAIPIEKTSPL